MIFRIVTLFRILCVMPLSPRTMFADNVWNVVIAITTLSEGRGEEHQGNLPDKFPHNFNKLYQQFRPGLSDRPQCITI